MCIEDDSKTLLPLTTTSWCYSTLKHGSNIDKVLVTALVNRFIQSYRNDLITDEIIGIEFFQAQQNDNKSQNIFDN